MQAQTYEGYVENGHFYPREIPMHRAGRSRAILMVLDALTQTEASLPSP